MTPLAPLLTAALLASPPCPTAARTVPVPGGTVYVEECGAGPPVVLIHGGNLDRRLWDGQFTLFARGHRVIRYDVRGFGRSTGQGAQWAAHIDLAVILDSLHVDRADLVGLSLGGRIAIDFALQYPARVRSLVLSGPGLSGFRWADSNETTLSYRRITARLRAGDSVGAALLWLDNPYVAPAMEQVGLRARIRELAVANASRWIQPDREAPLSPPAVGRLGEIRVPVLILVGRRDVSDIHRIVDTLMASLPRATRIDIPGAGHLLNLEAPDRFNRIVLDFLDRNR